MTSRKTGSEPVHAAGRALGFDLLDSWRWSSSDLLSNALRGRFAEYLGARPLGIATDGVRNEWDTHDLVTPNGTRIEVKSSAYVQSWAQTKPSAITFGIRPTFAQDGGPMLTSGPRARQAQVYVFALLHHRERATVDALDVSRRRRSFDDEIRLSGTRPGHAEGPLRDAREEVLKSSRPR